LNPVATYLDWKWSSGWLDSREGLLLVTDILTTCAEAVFRVKWQCSRVHLTQRMASPQVFETSVTNKSFRTSVTQMIVFNQGILSLLQKITRVCLNIWTYHFVFSRQGAKRIFCCSTHILLKNTTFHIHFTFILLNHTPFNNHS